MTKPEKILKQKLRHDGYNEVHLALNKVHEMARIHTLVGLHYLDNPNNLKEINHKKGVKTDNRWHQIEWSTASHNIQHSYRELGRKHADFSGNKNPTYGSHNIYLNIYTGIFYTIKEIADLFGLAEGSAKQMYYHKDKRVENFIKV